MKNRTSVKSIRRDEHDLFSQQFINLKVVFCWSDISGYMAACWRALYQTSNIDVFVIAFCAHQESTFADQLMQDIPCRLLDKQERNNFDLIKQLIIDQKPDIIVLAGWFHKPYRQLPFTSILDDMTFIMGMDTPWEGTWKQQLAPWLLRSFLKRMEHVVVTGERSWQYARHLGIPPVKITRGIYGVDYATWFPLWEARQQENWPRSFLFAGRYVSVKGIDVMVKAYRAYRSQVADPWPLICCGQGTLGKQLQEEPGIEDRGFLQPTAMQAVWQNAGVFLLPSRFDPWPLALVEAAAAGLPIICTDVCGSAVEVVRSGYNGWIIPEADPAALTQALVKVHQAYATLSAWGQRSQQLAAPYAADVWANQWRELVASLRLSKQ